MAYKKQNFTTGQTLKAEHLNYIENGIIENEANVAKCVTKEYVDEAIANVSSGGAITPSDDGAGNVTLTLSGNLSVSDDGTGNIVIG